MIRFIKTSAIAIATLCISISTASCNDDNSDNPDTIWDFVPYNATFIIEDANGINLLDHNVTGNYMNQPFSIEYDREMYQLNWRGDTPLENENEVKSRYLPPRFNGFQCCKLSYWNGQHWEYIIDKHMLVFGEFSTTSNYDINFTLSVPGQTEPYNVKIEFRFEWRSKNDPVVSVTPWLNGKKANTDYPLKTQWPPIRIVLPPLNAE